MSLQVLATGLLATVQDRGRAGWAHLGVRPSGAADRASLALANRLVGNRAGAAGLEVTLGGLRIRADQRHLVCVAGGAGPVLIDGAPTATGATLRLDPGAVLEIGRPERGLRSYLAVRGGIDVRAVLGSRSYDVLAALGPPPLRPGDNLAVGQDVTGLPSIDLVPPHPPPSGPIRLAVHQGPRWDWFADPARLIGSPWRVSADLDRVGVRLAGPSLARAVGKELPSEGIVRGAVQVPPSGQPLIFLADHPVTGGYPVIAVVADRDTDAVAQLVPGQTIQFRCAGVTPAP